MQHVHDVPPSYETIATLLFAEEEAVRAASLADWQDAQARRAALGASLWQLEQAVARLHRRFAALPALPALPPAEQAHWAQALLAFPNLAFLEVDTDGLGADADILRITLIDTAGAILFDQLCQPRRPLTSRTMHLTGITAERLVGTPHLVEVWEQVQVAFSGRYVLSFNLDFDEGKLAESAAREGLPPLTFIGECLMLRAQTYYGNSAYPKLADLCERLGSPLPAHPQQDALDRARGQAHPAVDDGEWGHRRGGFAFCD